jgi:eukaryotic-like serine/threonine-protein kinase
MGVRNVTPHSQSAVSARAVAAFPSCAAYEATDLVANKYRLVRLLGEGGTGTVWLARNVNLDAQIALKLLKSGTRNPDYAEQLLNEARAAACLRHPGIVRVFDYGQTERNEPFIVMEVLTGESLLELLDRERLLSATRAVQLLLPIADALASAHAHGVVHRDLKPDNVFITRSDSLIQPKVVDFGFAKRGLSDGNERGREQAVAGGLRYMAPEQVLGTCEVDHRADVWSFCAVLYECVAGRPPFDGVHYESLLFRIIDGAPTPITGAADAALSKIVTRGLSKQPERRWPNMRELGKALAAWLSRHGVTEDVSGNSLRAAWLGEPPSLAIVPGRALEAAPKAVRRLVVHWPAIASVAAAVAGASGGGAAWLARAGIVDLTGAQRQRPREGALGRVASAAANMGKRGRDAISQRQREEEERPEERDEERDADSTEAKIRANVEDPELRTSAARPTLPLQGRAGRP